MVLIKAASGDAEPACPSAALVNGPVSPRSAHALAGPSANVTSHLEAEVKGHPALRAAGM